MPKQRKQKGPLSLDYIFQTGAHEGEALWQVIRDVPEAVWYMIDQFDLELNDEAFDALTARAPR